MSALNIPSPVLTSSDYKDGYKQGVESALKAVEVWLMNKAVWEFKDGNNDAYAARLRTLAKQVITSWEDRPC